jgi:uncharacterized protein (DUF302 family)
MIYYSRKLKLPYDAVLNKVISNLEGQGFGLINAIDLGEMFRKNLQVTFRNYKILAVCNPTFAYRAVSLESHAGAMIQCNVVVQEHENGEVEVSAINPLESMAQEHKTTELVHLSMEIGIRLRASIDYIQREFPSQEDGTIYLHAEQNFNCFIPG